MDQFYIGSTSDSLETRLVKHNFSYYGNKKFTHRANDWKLFTYLECSSINQAIAIEKHIKAMKSKTYIRNLLKFDDLKNKLIMKYQVPGSSR